MAIWQTAGQLNFRNIHLQGSSPKIYILYLTSIL